MPTIKDVARLAGVSVSTVSNVLNGKGNISDEKYEKIMDAVHRLNYRPSMLARNLKKQRTRFVSALLPRMDSHYTMIFQGMQEILRGEGYHLIVETTNDDPALEEEMIKNMVDIGVRGLLIVPANVRVNRAYRETVLRDIPVIYAERRVEDLQSSAVVFDNRGLTRACALELMEQHGPDRVALVSGYRRFTSNGDCLEGFTEAYQQLGGSGEAWSFQCGAGSEQAFNALFQAVGHWEQLPECFLTTDASIAQALAEVVALLGEEARIVTLSGDSWRQASRDRVYPQHIPRNACQLGEESAKLLLEYMRNKVLFENRVVTVPNPAVRRYPSVPAAGGAANKTLDILLLESPTSDVLQKLAAGYQKQRGCRVRFHVRNYLPLYDEVMDEFQGKKSRYDVCMVDIPWINGVANSGYLHNLSDLVQEDRGLLDDFPPGIRRAFLRNASQIYGLPIMATIQFLFYRKDLFTNQELKRSFIHQYGFDLQPPRNWTEFNIVAEFFTRSRNPASPVEYGTSICGINPIGLVDEFLPRQWAFGGQLLDDSGKLAVLSPENLRALDNLKTAFALSPPGCDQHWWDTEFNELVGGKYAMIHGFASHYPILERAQSLGEYHNQISVRPAPGNKPMLGGWILGVNRQSEKLALGYDFIRWAVANERSAQSMLLGGAVPTKETCENALLRHAMPWLREMEQGFVAGGKRQVIRDRQAKIIDAYWLDSQIARHVDIALRGQCTNQEALSALQEIIAGAMQSE